MRKDIIEFFKLIIFAITLAVLVRSFVFQPFHIPSSSMVPNLLIGDHLFVDKFSYGYSEYSFRPVFTVFGTPIYLSPSFDGRYFYNEPNRGDVIVFKNPNDKQEYWIKRLVGLPGDLIEMKKGRLFINGKMIEREFVSENGAILYKETFDNGHEHIIREVSDAGDLDDKIKHKVPENHYFFMGDNRDNSNDSRKGFFVHRDLLIGKARWIFFSYDPDKGSLWEIWKWGDMFRWDRSFKSIQ